VRGDHPVRPASVDHRGDHGQHDRPADLERGLQDAGGKALLVIGDTGRGLDIQRGEAEPERGADQQHRGQQHGRVVRRHADPQEPRVARGQAGEAHGDHPGRAEPVKDGPHPRGGDDHQDPGRQERQRRAERRPARHDLQVLGDQELERHIGPEQHHGGQVGPGERP
jgi:hypothetical protein